MKGNEVMSAESGITVRDVAKMIDHSLLRPELTDAEIAEGCRLAARYGVASACVRPADTPLAARLLHDTGVVVCTVVGFPHGNSMPATKVFEVQHAIDDGATEIDMVINIGKLRSGECAYVGDEIRAVVGTAHRRGAVVKVIFENHYLTDEQIVQACHLAERARADFVKTSTGYAEGGATIPQVRLMRQSCGPAVKIKAAGGIRTLDQLVAFRDAGASRIGARATEAIMEEAQRRFKV